MLNMDSSSRPKCHLSVLTYSPFSTNLAFSRGKVYLKSSKDTQTICALTCTFLVAQHVLNLHFLPTTLYSSAV